MRNGSSAALAVMRCSCVCLSVCHVRTFCQNEYSYRQTVSPSGRSISLVFSYQTGRQYSDGNPLPPKGGDECNGCMKKWRFSTNISLYLRNDARYSHSYYGRRIGNRTQAFVPFLRYSASNNGVTLKYGLGVVQDHWNGAIYRQHTTYYQSSIVTFFFLFFRMVPVRMTLSDLFRTVSEIFSVQ